MSTLASLRILLGLDSGDVSKGAARVRQDLTGVQRSANTTRDALKGIGAGLGLGIGLGAFNVAAKGAQEFSQFVGDSITKASALNETLSKSSIIFGQDAKAVEAWGRTAATAFGQSTGQAIEARATLGNLFKTMGLGQAEVLGMSGSIVELASDLASFNNIPVDVALEKLRSGLVGQAEPLRTLGVQLTEANVKAKAMALGLVAANGALSESAKVQARYALILEQTGTAQGDFGRTSGGLANQQKALAAEFANLSTDIGALLVGPVTDLTKGLRELIPELREAAAAAGDFGKNVGNLLGPVGDLAAEIDRLTKPLFVNLDIIMAFGPAIHDWIVGTTAQERAAMKAGAATMDWVTAERTATAVAIAAAPAITALAGATVSLTSATQAGAEVMLEARGKALEAAEAEKEVAKWALIAADASAELNNDLLTAASGMDGFTASTNTATAALGHFLDAGKKLPSQTGRDEPGQNFVDGQGDPHLHPTPPTPPTPPIASNRVASEANRAAAERAAEAARRHADMLADQFDAAKDKARDYFDVLHEGNQRAIDDIRDRANEELTAQQKAIRGVVSAEQARINAVRAREQENSRRGAVADAETPEDRTSAQRDLNRFLEDQRLGRMSANADIAVALIDQEKAKNDALAAEATKAENTRAADQRAAFDDEIAALQKNLSRHPELWGKAQEAIKKLLRDSVPDFAAIGQAQIDAFEAPLKKLGLVPPSVTATSPNATATGLSSAGDHSHVIHNHLYLNGQEVMDWIERGLANNKAVHNPAPPSASGRV